MSAQFRKRTIILLAVAAVSAAVGGWLLQQRDPPAHSSAELTAGSAQSPLAGGRLLGSTRAEPRSFNRYVMSGQTEETIAFLTQAKLVRINRATDQVEPWIAESWEEISRQSAVDRAPKIATGTGPAFRVKLRKGVTFSDGAPFTSADVLFALEAIYDPRVKSPLASALRVGNQPLSMRALNEHEVEVVFPSPYAPGMRLLDALWILPKHKLEGALRAGTMQQAWGLTTAPSEMAGLGPFVLREYRPGERIGFERNQRYWRRDREGRPLPYLDGITLEVLPDQTAELLRLQSGQLDFTHSEVRSEDYLTLKRAQNEGRVKLLDLGISLDGDPFWFNLSQEPALNSRQQEPGRSQTGRHQARTDRKPWLGRPEFRRAISLAVNRKAYADTVFLGAAVPVHGPVTPGNVSWYWPELPGGEYDPPRAKTLLAGLGLIDRNGDGRLEDPQGQRVQFSVTLQRGIAAVERGAAFVRDELAKIGVQLDMVTLDAGAVVAQWSKRDYEAIFHHLIASDSDPAASLDFWLSSGGVHVWNPEQKAPASDWEAAIDGLMRRQVATADHSERVRLFREAQRIFSEHDPALYFAAPRLFLAMSARVTNATPSRTRPLILWSADTLAIARDK